MPFSTVFQLYQGGQCTYPCFPGVLLTSTPHNTLFKPLTAFPHDHYGTMDSGERPMNPIETTIINPQKEYWLSQDRTRDLLFSSPVHYRLRYGLCIAGPCSLYNTRQLSEKAKLHVHLKLTF